MGNYWSATRDYIDEHKEVGPKCSIHGCEMFAADDHGRFICPQCGAGSIFDSGSGVTNRVPMIPQIATEMPDEEKAKVPGINRLYLKPTVAEAEMFDKMLSGEDYMDSMGRVDEERRD